MKRPLTTDTHIYFPTATLDRIKKLAKKQHRTVSGQIVLAVEEMLERSRALKSASATSGKIIGTAAHCSDGDFAGGGQQVSITVQQELEKVLSRVKANGGNLFVYYCPPKDDPAPDLMFYGVNLEDADGCMVIQRVAHALNLDSALVMEAATTSDEGKFNALPLPWTKEK